MPDEQVPSLSVIEREECAICGHSLEPTWGAIGCEHATPTATGRLRLERPVDVEYVRADQLRGAVEALEQARDLVAQAYSDDEDNDSTGNMAFAVLIDAISRFGGK